MTSPHSNPDDSPVNTSRRHVIGTLAAGALSLAGCLETTDTDSGADQPSTTESSPTAARSETSREGVVRFNRLSPEAQTEVKKAIQQGLYSGCKPLAVEKAIDLEKDPLIKYQEQLYKPVLMIGGAGKEPEGECPENALQMEKVTTTLMSAPNEG
jgi:hypothetical protein